MTYKEFKFLSKYLTDVPDSDNKLYNLAVDPKLIPPKDKKRLLAFDDTCVFCYGYHSIVNYADLK